MKAAELAKSKGVSIGEMNKRLTNLLDAKKIQRIKGRNDGGRVCWFYGVR